MNKNKSFVRLLVWPAVAAAALLMIPLIAMQFSGEVDWSPFDFLVAGILLFGTGTLYQFITSRGSNTAYKFAAAIACASGLFLIWANLAVGIVGSEDNPINVIYYGVIAIGLLGAIISNFRAEGMSYTMFAMTGAMLLIPVGLILFAVPEQNEMPWFSVLGFFALHGFFAVQYAISALLFRRAAQEANRSKSSDSNS